MNDDDFDNHIKTMEACGKAFGFVIAAALTEAAASKPLSAASFSDSLASLCEAERFSPDVTIVIHAIIDGARAFPGASRKISQGEEIV